MAEILAPDVDRLPWLTDDKVQRKKASRWWLGLLGALAVAAIAAAAFWFGLSQSHNADEPSPQGRPQTVPLPAPVPATPAPIERATHEPEPALMPDVEPAPAPAPVVMRMQQDVHPSIQREPIVRRVQPVPAKPVAVPAKPAPERKALTFTNPWDSSAASGRMVRIGTYATLRQGKIAWSRLAKAFPAMKKLPAVVTDIQSQRNGRVYYRLQIGTTSQAHSEVLCQRMRAIGQSCVVVDIAGARKGSWDERQPAGL